jgi:hypothetical protein
LPRAASARLAVHVDKIKETSPSIPRGLLGAASDCSRRRYRKMQVRHLFCKKT